MTPRTSFIIFIPSLTKQTTRFFTQKLQHSLIPRSPHGHSITHPPHLISWTHVLRYYLECSSAIHVHYHFSAMPAQTWLISVLSIVSGHHHRDLAQDTICIEWPAEGRASPVNPDNRPQGWSLEDRQALANARVSPHNRRLQLSNVRFSWRW